ncbi:hypothetical protein [Nonomuraea sediminis]|uniref:hypothetical protein n=1 Tax=Nonomuraea sediminis TaxID=2835864 RepID=UPI001BDC1453|nr:hypothetical protein [Nonomuraea sediminis]
MDAMQVLAHETAMGYQGSLHEALPEAPVKPDKPPAKIRLARTLRRTADRLDPVPACP